MPSSARTGAVHSSSRSSAAAAGYSRRGLEVDQPAVQAVADRAPHVLLDQPRRRVGERHALVDVARGLRDAGDDQRRRAPRTRRRFACASQIRTSTVPNVRCGRTDHQTCVYSTIESVRDQERRGSRGTPSQPPKASGTPQRGKLLVKICVRAECRPRVEPVDERRVAPRSPAAAGSTGRSRSHDAHRAVGVAHADVDVQRERVVAPGDVLEPVLDAAVVLGVDDLLLAVVGPRVRAGRAERDAVRGRRARTGGRATSRCAADRVVEVLAAAGADLDLRGDQLAGDRGRQHRVGLARRRAAPRSAARGRASPGRGSRTPPRGRR